LLGRTFKVAVELADSREISFFSLCLRTEAPAAFGIIPPELQLASVFDSRREGVAPIAKRDSPVRDGAGRILPQYRSKSFYCTAELERMQQSNRAIKFSLCRLVARGSEVNLSQLLGGPMLVFLRHYARRSYDQQHSSNDFRAVHLTLPGLRLSGLYSNREA
jgi:hypothetical protein